MDMDSPALAFVFVLFIFIAPLLFISAPFLFFLMVAGIAGYKAGDAHPALQPVRTPARKPRSRSLRVAGYVRLVSNCPREGNSVSWKSEIQLGGGPARGTRIASRCLWVTRGPAGCWQRLVLMETSTTTAAAPMQTLDCLTISPAVDAP
jgi:hypothetical protein